MKEKQKLIVTLWRGQLDNPQNYDSICCRLLYNYQEQNSRHIHSSKSLTWKQTFVFPLAKFTTNLKLDFINMQQIKEIHFAKDQVMDSLAIGKSNVSIDLDHSNRGTVPAKLNIINEDEQHIGIVFIEYEILKTEVTYIVEKLLDYEYLLKMSSFKISFFRNLSTVPSFYLKFQFGGKTHKQDFSFEEASGQFFYNYPIKLYMRFEKQVEIELQLKDNYKKDYRNPNTSFDTQSVASNAVSIRKGNKKNQPIDLRSIEKLTTVLDLNMKQDCTIHKKLPLAIDIKGQSREIANLQFDIEVIYKSAQEKEELLVQKKRQHDIKNGYIEIPKPVKKKQKKYEVPKNGVITINSIIGKFEAFNEQIMENKDVTIELKLGKISHSSVLLENPGTQIVWMDTFTFKRTWEQNIKFIIFLHSESVKLPTFYTQVNLRELFAKGRYMAKKIEVRDDKNAYCGVLTVDITYKEEEQKPKPVEVKKVEPQLTAQQKQELSRDLKQRQIRQRMQKREEAKRKRRAQYQSSVPSYSDKQLYLPPLRPQKSSDRKLTLSPRKFQNSSVNVYNTGGQIVISQSPRFYEERKKQSNDSFFFRAESDFEKNKKGASIGYGNKFDFTKQYEKAPGAGRYQVPSIWDKYK